MAGYLLHCVKMAKLSKFMRKNKKVALASAIILGGMLLSSPILAQDNNNGLGNNKDDKEGQQQMVNVNASGRVTLRGTLDSIGTNTLTIKSWGGIWNINIATSTKLVRNFGGASNLSEFQKGDWVSVQGKINDSAAWTIDATIVKNSSIQAKNADFSGIISNMSSSTFSLTTAKRGTVQVTVNADAKIIVDHKTGVITDLKNGMVAKIKGVWNRAQSSVAASWISVKTAVATTIETEKNHGKGKGRE